MNKAELVEKIADAADISKASADRALSAAIDAIIKAVTKGDDVQLIGFGTFKSGKRAARVGRNPATGAEIKILMTDANTGHTGTDGCAIIKQSDNHRNIMK